MSKEYTDYLKRKAAMNRAVNRLNRAMVAYEFKGAGNPDDIPLIEEELRKAKIEFKRQLRIILEPWSET